jgi:DNA-binding CsgD family transcriptional regulator
MSDGLPDPSCESHLNYTAHLDPGMRIVAAERGFAREFGRRSDDVCGCTLHDLLHPRSSASVHEHLDRIAAGAVHRFTDRVTGLRSTDQTFTAELTGVAVQDIAGLLTGVVVNLHPDHDEEWQEKTPEQHRPLLDKVGAQVLEGVAGGASNMQLATRLFLSRQGVDYHVGRMLRLLGAPNRAALVARAYALGVLALGVWPPQVLDEFIR